MPVHFLQLGDLRKPPLRQRGPRGIKRGLRLARPGPKPAPAPVTGLDLKQVLLTDPSSGEIVLGEVFCPPHLATLRHQPLLGR
ncbi:hypothetical protein SAVIM40S_00368 [Streptomyces avidinii]